MSWNDCVYCGHSESLHTLMRDVKDNTRNIVTTYFTSCGGAVSMYKNEIVERFQVGFPVYGRSMCDCVEFKSSADFLIKLVKEVAGRENP